MSDNFTTEPDVVLIGAGVMSSTLGVFLKELEPSLTIDMFETLENCGLIFFWTKTSILAC